MHQERFFTVILTLISIFKLVEIWWRYTTFFVAHWHTRLWSRDTSHMSCVRIWRGGCVEHLAIIFGPGWAHGSAWGNLMVAWEFSTNTSMYFTHLHQFHLVLWWCNQTRFYSVAWFGISLLIILSAWTCTTIISPASDHPTYFALTSGYYWLLMPGNKGGRLKGSKNKPGHSSGGSHKGLAGKRSPRLTQMSLCPHRLVEFIL